MNFLAARMTVAVALLVSASSSPNDARAQNLIPDGSFELGVFPAPCGIQGVLVDTWFQASQVTQPADTYTMDCQVLPGLDHGAFQNFSGLTGAADGVRFSAGWSTGPESFGTTLSSTLSAGQRYRLSAYFTKSHPHAGTVGYDVYISPAQTLGGVAVGNIGSGAKEDTWTFDCLEFVAQSVSGPYFVLSPAGTNSYIGTDDWVLAQTQSVLHYGAGLPGSGGYTPNLELLGCPLMGRSVTLQLTDGLGGAPGLLVVGSTATSLSFAGGTLLASLGVLTFHVLPGTPGVPGEGAFALPAVVPAGTPSGLTAYLQCLYVDSGAVEGYSLSDGLKVTIG